MDQRHQDWFSRPLSSEWRATHAIGGSKAKIVELRFFGGLTVEETALSMELSFATVERETPMAQLWMPVK